MKSWSRTWLATNRWQESRVQFVVVNYHYTQVPSSMVRWLRYVTRATFLDCSWDEELADRLYRHNNMVVWGSWPGADAWDLPPQDAELEGVALLESGRCPQCHEPIIWDGGSAWLIKTVELPIWGYEPLGGGYWVRVKQVLGPMARPP